MTKGDDDDDSAGEQRYAGDCEGEKVEGRRSGIGGSLHHQHIDGCAGEREQRSRVSCENYSNCEVARFSLTAIATIIGSNAATAPFMVINGLSMATSAIISTNSLTRLSPTWAISA